MALQIWLPLNKNLKNNGLLSGITTTKKGTISFEAGGPSCGYLVSGNGTQIANGISVNTNLLDVLTGTSTVSVFVKPNGTHVHYNGTILSSGDWNSKRWAFGVSQDNSKVDMFGPGHNTYKDCPVTVGEWTHLVSIYDKEARKGYLYKNAQYIGDYTFSETPTFSSTTNEFCVGRETYANGYFSFNGNISDLRIYDHRLTEEDIKRLYQCKTLDLVTQNNVLFDRDGQFVNGIVPYNISMSGNTIYFNGSTAAIRVPFTELQSGTFTINTWFYKDSFGPDRWETIFGGPSGFELEMKNASASTPVIVTYSWGTKQIPYSLNQWNMLTMTRTSGGTKFYLNGEYKQSGSAGSIPATSSTAGQYFIGAWKTYGGQNFKGYVKEFSIYSKELQASEISKLYEIGPQVDVLPDDYIQLEYIQSTGTQYIDTLIHPTINTGVQLKMTLTTVKSSDNVVFGATDKVAYASGKPYSIDVFSNQVLFPHGATSSNSIPYDAITASTVANQIMNLQINYYGDNKVIYNDNKKSKTATESITSKTLHLFNLNNSNGGLSQYAPSGMKCYSLKITEGSVLVGDFVPAKRKSDNAIGMYDMVSRQFFTNSGTGSFTGA